MKIKSISYKIKCDVCGCENLANFVIEAGGQQFLHICKNCLSMIKKGGENAK